jgi:branched-chain amino acid transport system ATP-binding protein
MALLELKNASKFFGGLAAVLDLNMEVHEDEILGLIGPNGAGKTTTFSMITGDYPPSKGDIFLEGKTIAGLRSHKIARLGVVRSFQLNTLFPHLSVQENVLLGLHLRSTIGFWEGLVNTKSNKKKEHELNKEAQEIMAFMGLEAYLNEQALNLPHGYQRALGIAIALSSRPKILLLDEPLTGMNPKEVANMLEIIRKIRDDFGLTIVVVEHNMKAVMALCERIVVINFGQKIAEGTSEEIQTNKAVIEAYLGSENDVAGNQKLESSL